MKAVIILLALNVALAAASEEKLLPIERQVAEAVEGPKTTVIHFWAPWCANCYAELAHADGWSKFIGANPAVNFIFVTSWSAGQGDGRAILAKRGVGPQKNFQLLLHPNDSIRESEKMTRFLDFPITWLPATWVFRDGKLRYALNYGEVRFPVLQQLIKDTTEDWER